MPDGSQWSINLRPQVLGDVFGQEFIKKDIYNRLSKGKGFPKAMLFEGQLGCGKTTVAKIIAKMIQCQHPKENGDPCGECLSCKSIENESFGRNTYMIDCGGNEGSKDILPGLLDSYTKFPPMKDKNIVIILEEIQRTSPEARSVLLKMLEKPKSNVYFLFTAMESLSKPDSGSAKVIQASKALVSRCQTFKFPPASVKDVAFYLLDCMKKLNIWNDPKIPQEFKTSGVYTIATNCSGSYRTALQCLEQCVDSEMFTKEDIIKYSNMVDVTDFYGVLNSILNGKPTPDVMETLFNGDCESQFRLSNKVIADAEAYSIFHKIPGESDYFEKQAAQLAGHKNFKVLLDGFADIQKNSPYFNKNIYVMGVCEMIKKCASLNNTVSSPLKESIPTGISRTISNPAVSTNTVIPSRVIKRGV